MPTLAANYLNSIVKACISLGASEDSLYVLIPGGKQALEGKCNDKGADPKGISSVVVQQSHDRFSLDTLYAVLSETHRQTGREDVGLVCGNNIRPSSMNELGTAVMCCATLRQAILLNRRYQPLTQQLGRTQLVFKNGLAYMGWDDADIPAPHNKWVSEMVMVGHALFGRWLTWVADKEINAVHFKHKQPEYLNLYQEMFGCPIFFEQAEDAILIDLDIIDTTLPQPNALLLAEICGRLDKEMAQLSAPSPIHVQVADILRIEVPRGVNDLDTVASKLGLSPRGLRRVLMEEKTSYREILEKTRRVLCEGYLMEGIPFLAIADRLGYSQQSAFNRAFKLWYGVSPKAYKKAQDEATQTFDNFAP